MAFSVYADGSLLYSSVDLGEDKIVNPKLKVELNKAGSFTFSMLPTHSKYSSLHPMKTLITVVQDGVQLFRGRVIECKSDFFKQLSVTCEGDLAFLLDSVVAPFKYIDNDKKTIRQVFKHIVDEHNGQVENWKKFSYSDSYITVTKDETSSVTATDEFDHTSYSDSSSALTQELVDAYGGILRTRTVGNTTYLDYIKDPSQTNTNYPLNSQEIQFSVNLLDIDQSYPVSDIFTILLPIGGDKITIESVNNGNKYLENQDAINKFGRIVKVEQWSDERDKNKLKAKAQEYLKVHSKVFPNDLTVKAIDLHYLDPSNNTQLKLGDRVRCVSTPHDIDIVLICLSIDYDLQNPENNSYKLGSYIRSDKHKGKISKSSSKGGRSGSSRRTGSSSTSLSSIMAGTTTEAEDTKEEEKTGFWTNAKNYARLMVGKIQEDVDEALTPIKPKTGSFWSLDNLIDEAKNLIFPEYQVVDENNEPRFDDQGNPITETVKDLLHMDNDVYNINARKIQINADERIDMYAPVISLTSSLETFIGGYSIKIGDDATAKISMTAKEIELTGLIRDLIVDDLSAGKIASITTTNKGTITTNTLTVNGRASVPDQEFGGDDTRDSDATNVKYVGDAIHYIKEYYLQSDDAGSGPLHVVFKTAKVLDDGGTDEEKYVASRKWVKDNLKGGTLTGYFNILSVKEGGQDRTVASQYWVDQQNFATKSEIPSLDGYATQTWANNRFTRILDHDQNKYITTLDYKKRWVQGTDGNSYWAYVSP